MRSNRKLGYLITLAIFLFGSMACSSQGTAADSNGNLEKLVGWMTGSFSSQKQAERDTLFIDVRLEAVQIWPERNDGFWLYVEQAAALSLDKPYRQRIYHLTQPDESTFISASYTFDEPLRFAGKFSNPEQFNILSPDSLTEREGCAIKLTMLNDSTFCGSTNAQDCASSLNEASFATSEVVITATELWSWDRGFDSNDNQVWGSEFGPYIFEKIRK